MRKQLKRWSHGFVQNVKLHWDEVLETPFLRSFIMVALWDAVIASIAYLILIPVLAVIYSSPILLVGYIIDIPVLVAPVLYTASQRKETKEALGSIPSFFVLRTVNSFFILEAIFTELLFRRPLNTYEKGH